MKLAGKFEQKVLRTLIAAASAPMNFGFVAVANIYSALGWHEGRCVKAVNRTALLNVASSTARFGDCFPPEFTNMSMKI